MDKKVLYALLGGAAVAVAAIAYSMSQGSSDEGPTTDDILDQLGPVERDATGMLEFEYFLKIFQICTVYGKTQFNERKREMITQRRAALKDGDDKKYEEIVMQMTQEQEQLVQSKLFEIIELIGVSEQEFHRNTMHHGQDPNKGMQIMQVQQAAESSGNSDPPLTKQKTMETFKLQQQIQMGSMEKMMKDGIGNANSQEG